MSAIRRASIAISSASKEQARNQSTSSSPLVGRDAELGVLERLIERSRQQGNSIVVRGDPGVGKSTLLFAAGAMARATGALVVEVSGVESEGMPPFVGLDRLLRPLLSAPVSMPAVQRRALLTAFKMKEGPAPELFLIALAALTLIVASASNRPVVLIVDDVQWVDAPTIEVLGFISRRLHDDPVAVIFGLREGHDISVGDEQTHEIAVSGLTGDSAGELLDSVAPDLTHSDRLTILEHAQGNPLALVELPRAWRAAGAGALGVPSAGMPLSTRLEHTFAARVTDLPPSTRDALLIAAIDADGNLTEVQDATRILAGAYATDLLEPAEEAGLVRLDDLVVRFRHPLVRSGVLRTASAQQRRAAHAALSAALPPHSYRRIWHHALAVQGTDDSVADELDASAVDSVKRGSVITAVASLERAAQLTSVSRRRGRRLLLAAQYAFGLGRADMVNRLVDAAVADDLSELDVARAEWLREIFNEGELGDSARIRELCRFAALSEEAGETDLALDLLSSAALRCWWAVAAGWARDRVVEVAESLSSSQDDPRCIAAIAVARPVEKGAQTHLRLSSPSTRRVSDADGLLQLGMAARALGAEADAADYFDRSASELRKQGRLGLLSHVHAIQAAVLLDLGHWRRAKHSLDEARDLAKDTGQPPWATGTVAVHSVFSALTGDAVGALERAEMVEKTSSSPPVNDWLSLAQLARGISQLASGQHATAYTSLEPLFEPQDPRHHPRQQFSAIMFIVEAAVGCGALREAHRLIDRMEETAAVTPSPILGIHLLYATAVLAADAEAERLYRHALEQDLTRWPWPRARIELAYGNWLRRQRRPIDSREPLRRSLGTFELIGATDWAHQARSALRAAGEVNAEVKVVAATLLSSQELEIATLAAQGLSNREIGERLYLSPRTVGSHLYRIFPKLAVKSRSQLANRLSNS